MAVRADISMIFTNNSAWTGADARERFTEFAGEAERIVRAEGGRVQFVRVTAPLHVLEERVNSESRQMHRKLVDVGRLRDLVSALDQTSLHADDLVIDTSVVSPEDAAASVLEAVRR